MPIEIYFKNYSYLINIYYIPHFTKPFNFIIDYYYQ